MTPFTLPSLQLATNWTAKFDSPQFPEHRGGTSPQSLQALPPPQMEVQFHPVQRPAGELWPNAYILHRNAYQASTQFAYITNITFPTATDIINCNAYEQDFQINDGQHIFNWGWQWLFGTGLRIWNRGGPTKWNDVHIPFTFTPGIPVPLIVTFAIVGSSVVTLT